MSRLSGWLEEFFFYEHQANQIVARMWKHFRYILLLIVISMIVGTVGFYLLGTRSWIDAFLNAAMLLGGMGPVGAIDSWHSAGKIFAALFSLYSGLVFLTISGLLFAPVFREILHRFHSSGGR